MSPATLTLCKTLVRLAKGMIGAFEEWIKAEEATRG